RSGLRRRDFRVRCDDEVRQLVPVDITGIRADAPAFPAPIASVRARADPVLFLVLDAQDQMRAIAFGERRAERERRVGIVAVAFERSAVVDLSTDAFEIAVEN